MIGQTLDHYRIIAQLGEGGMGVVYRARDEVLNRDVAVKLLAQGAIDKVGSGHLLREAQTASSLSHPNICTIHQVGQTRNDFYVVMELIEGRSLSDLLTTTGLSMEIVTRYGAQIADALAHAHDRGIVHRDMKGSNVMVTAEGRVKVLDFGLATRMEREEISELTLSYDTLESKLVGTLPYMSPEVLRGHKADHLSDLWALGVLLYEAAGGRLPFRGNTGFEVTSAILREPPPPLPPTVPYGLGAVIQRCLMKEPGGALPTCERSAGGTGGTAGRGAAEPASLGRNARAANIGTPWDGTPHGEKRGRAPAGRHEQRSVFATVVAGPRAVGCGWTVFSRPGRLRDGV